jgi:hypothetical protein
LTSEIASEATAIEAARSTTVKTAAAIPSTTAAKR